MSMEVADQIRSDLAQESRSRAQRSIVLLALFAGLALSLIPVKGFRASLGPQDVLALTVALGFALLGISASASAHLRLAPAAAAALGVLAFLSPLLGATSIEPHLSGVGCGLTLAGIGLVALVSARMILGRTRRRFGGATQLQAVACASTAALAVGLECPASDAVHLFMHAAGAVLVGAGLARALLR